MNRIAALLSRDRGPVQRAELENVAGALDVGGGGTTEVVMTASAGVATRNGTGFSAPATGVPLLARNGRLLAVDARIDNRDELERTLGLEPLVSDTELIFAAFERWGEDAARHLVGDFAIVLVDPVNESLLCARDGAGARQILYFISETTVAVASQMKGLLRLPSIPRGVDECAVRDHLLGTLGDPALTLLSGVRRLPPGHVLTVTPRATRLRCFWRPEVGPELRLGSDEEYTEAFREVLFEAVRCRLRGPGKVGTGLSGGLDSSSISAVCRDLVTDALGAVPRAYSARFPDVPRCDEGPYIDAVCEMGGLESVSVRADVIGPMETLAKVRLEAPLHAPNVHLAAALLGAVREDGVSALLDGHDGDTAVSHGLAVLPELLRRGRLLRFVHEARGLARSGHARFLSLVRQNLVRSLAPRGVRRTFLRWAGHPRVESQWPVENFDRAFAERTGAAARLEEWREFWARPLAARGAHARALGGALPPFVSEILDRVGGAFGVEARHPFYDRRLLEFCLSLPLEQRLQKGATRGILRSAMKGILPEKVRTRPGKQNLTHQFVDALVRRERARLEEFVSQGARRLDGYLDPAAFKASGERLLARPTKADAEFVFSAYALSLTLEDLADRG